jgi:hypothetical protein
LAEIEAGGLFGASPIGRNAAADVPPPTATTLGNARLSPGCAGNVGSVIDAVTAHGRIHEGRDPETLRAGLITDNLQAGANAEGSSRSW